MPGVTGWGGAMGRSLVMRWAVAPAAFIIGISALQAGPALAGGQTHMPAPAGRHHRVGKQTTRAQTASAPAAPLAWLPAEAPLPADADSPANATLQDVSCPAPGSCVAVGSYTDQSGAGQDLIETLSAG